MALIDAIAYWPPTDKAYFFSGDDYVRYRMAGSEGAETRTALAEGYWEDLEFTSGIDAAATAAPLDVVYFFKGNQVVEFGISKPRGNPAVEVGEVFPNLPQGLDRDFDTVVFWPANGKMYFFKGNLYVRYDPAHKRAEGGPVEIATNWPGLTFTDIDASLVGKRGKAYFFKGAEYITYPVVAGSDPALHEPRPWSSKWPGLAQMLGASSPEKEEPKEKGVLRAVSYIDYSISPSYRGSIYFDSASYAIRAEDRPALDGLLARESDLKALESNLEWTLTGYADPRNVQGGNDRLSGARAEAVQRYWGERLPPHPEVPGLPEEDAKAMQVDGITFEIVAGGVDPVADRVPGKTGEQLSFHRRVDVVGPPIPRVTRGRRRPPPADHRGKLWEGKIHQGAGTPSISVGPGAEALTVFIRGLDGGESGKFLYVGPNISWGVALARTGWTGTATDEEIRVRDFEGPAWHVAGKVPQPGVAVATDGLFTFGPAIFAGDSPIAGFVWAEAGFAQPPKDLYDLLSQLGGGASIGAGVLFFQGVEEAPE